MPQTNLTPGPAVSRELPPPRRTLGPWEWLRKNLFSTWYHSLLTVVFGYVVYVALTGLIRWVFTQAQWAVVAHNLPLFFVGTYPAAERWRLWLVLVMVALLLGASWAAWDRFRPTTAAWVAGALLLLMVLPITGSSRLWLLGAGLAVALGFLVVRRFPRLGRWIVLHWVVAFFVALALARGFAGSTLLPPVQPVQWGGLFLTILLAAVGIVASFPLGVLLALGRQSRLPAIRYTSIFYIEIIRGMPLITLLFMAQLLVPLFMPQGVRPDNVLRAMLAFTVFTSAYLAEAVRGGLQAVPQGQGEAARALGLKGWQVVGLVVLPQALRNVIPALVGQFIALFKDTSLVYMLGLMDLLGVSKAILAQGEGLGRHFEVYAFVGLMYWLFSYLMSYGSRRLERSLGVGQR